jgi:hypothetical protein
MKWQPLKMQGLAQYSKIAKVVRCKSKKVAVD